jgi:hypothetical protein
MVGGLARRSDRALDVLGAGVGHLGEFAFGRRLDIGEARAARRRNVSTSDEQIGFHLSRLIYRFIRELFERYAEQYAATRQTQLNFLEFHPQDN